jgi:hypothetical protein
VHAHDREAQEAVSEALQRARVLGGILAEGLLVLDPVTLGVLGTGTAKRKIFDLSPP